MSCVTRFKKKKKKKKTLNNNYKEFHKAIKAYGTSPRSHSPLLNPVLRFVTSTDPTVAACPPE